MSSVEIVKDRLAVLLAAVDVDVTDSIRIWVQKYYQDPLSNENWHEVSVAEPRQPPYGLLRGDDLYVLSINFSELWTLVPALQSVDRYTFPKVLAAAAAVNTFPPNFWVKFPIAKLLELSPTIEKATKITLSEFRNIKIVGQYRTTRCVDTNTVELTVARAIACAFNKKAIAIVYGESGCGKSSAMVLAAVVPQSDNLTPFVVYVNPLDISENADIKGSSKDERNKRAEDLLTRLVLKQVRKEYIAAEVQPYHAVIVVDELGDHPEFVRGVCALGGEWWACLAAQLSVSRVSVVLGGTGCERPDLSPGSMPETFELIHARTALWRELVASNPLLQPFDAVMTPPHANEIDMRSVTAKLAYDLTSNARAAALLAEAISKFCDVRVDESARNYSLLFGLAAQLAALEYKAKNGMKNLSAEEHRLVVLSAVAVAHFLPCRKALRADHALSSALVTRYGVVVDRAKVVRVASAAVAPEAVAPAAVAPLASGEGRTTDKGKHLTLDAEFNGQRFDVSPAQMAVLKLLMNTATRDPSGEGFEISTADYLLFALMLAKGGPGAIINEEVVEDVICQPLSAVPDPRVAPAQVKNAWVSQKDFIRALASQFKGQQPCGTVVCQLEAKLDLSTLKLDTPQEAAEVMTGPQEAAEVMTGPRKAVLAVPLRHYAEGKDVICLNAPKASFADVVVLAHGPEGGMTVLLVQCKRYLGTRLTSAGVHKELEKMGWTKKRCREAAEASSLDPALAEWKKDFKAQGVKIDIRFVVVVYGEKPSEPPRDLGTGVHLVYSPTGKFFLVDVQPDMFEARTYQPTAVDVRAANA